MSERDYEVGYGRPPVQSQFQPGRSGNPRGRPRGSQSHSTIVRRVALRQVAIGVETRKRNIDLVLDAVRRAAAKGDFIGLSLVKKYTGIEEIDEPPIAKGVLIIRERLTLEEWLAEYGHLGEPDGRDRGDRDPKAAQPSSGSPAKSD